MAGLLRFSMALPGASAVPEQQSKVGLARRNERARLFVLLGIVPRVRCRFQAQARGSDENDVRLATRLAR